MGLKFLCHHCEHPIHVKDFLAGKRGKCPQCGGSIRIPANGEEYSLPISNDLKGTDSVTEVTTEIATVAVTVDHRTSAATVTSHKGMTPSSETRAPSDRTTAPTQALATPPATPAKSTNNIPEVISEAPNAAWYVRPPSGGQYGPAVGAVFWDWLNEKRVGESSLVWREGWGTWQTAKDVFPDFFRPSPNPAVSKPPQSIAPPEPVTAAPIVTASVLTGKADSVGSLEVKGIDATAESRRSVQVRRKKSHSKNLLLLVSLGLLALVLVVTLVVVLVMQSGG